MSVFNNKFSLKDVRSDLNEPASSFKLNNIENNKQDIDIEIKQLFPKKEFLKIESFVNSDTITKASAGSKKRVKFKTDLVNVTYITNRETVISKKQIICRCLIF